MDPNNLPLVLFLWSSQWWESWKKEGWMNYYTFRPGGNAQATPLGGGGKFDTVSSNTFWICFITLHHVQCSSGRAQVWACGLPPLNPPRADFQGLAFLMGMIFSLGQRQLENSITFITVHLLSGSIFGWGMGFGGCNNFIQFSHNEQNVF